MTREFISPAQHLAYDKIAPWMKEIFGSAAKEHPDIPVFGVSLGSAFAVVQVAAWQNDARIVVRAYLTTGTELTADLLRELLRRNDTLPFGAFGVDESGDVFIQHSAVGSTCDKLELGSIVMSVLQTADDADDDLIERYGGEMALGYMW
ncbi:MAG: YbjN domain-containing protein [Chloroflexaceae bacterium]|nr:YbjN domain-containing protein [Chloroflexaceae bacterium]NJO05558.1 YbjN domain-containing protein [Chloroflexaceae bacterium]